MNSFEIMNHSSVRDQNIRYVLTVLYAASDLENATDEGQFTKSGHTNDPKTAVIT